MKVECKNKLIRSNEQQLSNLRKIALGGFNGSNPVNILMKECDRTTLHIRIHTAVSFFQWFWPAM